MFSLFKYNWANVYAFPVSIRNFFLFLKLIQTVWVCVCMMLWMANLNVNIGDRIAIYLTRWWIVNFEECKICCENIPFRLLFAFLVKCDSVQFFSVSLAIVTCYFIDSRALTTRLPYEHNYFFIFSHFFLFLHWFHHWTLNTSYYEVRFPPNAYDAQTYGCDAVCVPRCIFQ